MSQKLLRTAIAAGLALALGGCSLFSSDSPRAPVKLTEIQQSATVNTVWSTKLGSSEHSFLTPALAGNGLYAAGSNEVFRIDPSNGAKVWTASLKEKVVAGVGSDGYFVAVGTDQGNVVALSAEGKELWRRKMPSEVDMPPLVGHDLVIVHTSDTRVTAFNARTGEQAWYYQGQVPILSVRAPRQMIFFADGILVGQANGKLIGISLTGKVAFEASISMPSGITEVERLNDVVGAPLVTSGVLCAASYQGRVTCMSPQNGSVRWTEKVDAVTGPTADLKTVYVVDEKSTIHAYSLATGGELWKNDTMKYRQNSAPVAVGSYVASGDYDGYVHLLDPITGREMGRGRLSGAIYTTPIAYGDGAIFQTVDGELAFIRSTSR